VYRLEELRRRTEAELGGLPASIESARKELEEAQGKPFRTKVFDLERDFDKLEKRGPVLERRLARLASARLGFISAPEVDADLLGVNTEGALAGTSLAAIRNKGTSLEIGTVPLNLVADRLRYACDRTKCFLATFESGPPGRPRRTSAST